MVLGFWGTNLLRNDIYDWNVRFVGTLCIFCTICAPMLIQGRLERTDINLMHL